MKEPEKKEGCSISRGTFSSSERRTPEWFRGSLRTGKLEPYVLGRKWASASSVVLKIEEDPRGCEIMEVDEFEAKAKVTLSRLGLGHWRVAWLPDLSPPIRGRAIPDILLIEIFDLDVDDAWVTFIHEAIEIKLRPLLRVYRMLINKLIEGYQELADAEKDRFIEELDEVYEVARGSPPSS